MIVDNVLVRSLGNGQVSISWTSLSEEMWSWIFVSGKRTLGPYMAETTNRSVTIPIATDGTFIVEVHDFDDGETVPESVEQKPLVKPHIGWNSVGHFEDDIYRYGVQQDREQSDHLAGQLNGAEAPVNSHPRWVETAAAYRIYHTIFDTGSIESLLLEVPPMGMQRMEIDCPKTLEGRNGRWHSFRIETVDQFGNESENSIVPHFAVDLPPVPELVVSRDTETARLTFRIV